MASLHLDWFGGEPLMCFDSVMKPICRSAKKICTDQDTGLYISMTTNVFFINKEMISFFKEYGIRGFQITLDGNKDTHNKTRFYGKDKNETYNIIVNNICLLTSIEQTTILLRINHTKDSLDNTVKIIDDFLENIRARIEIILVQVWQDRSYNSSKERETLNEKEVKIYNVFKDVGFKTKKMRFSTLGSCISCYADKENEAINNYDGRIFKYTTADFSEFQEDGILTDTGEIKWNEKLLSKRLARATFDNKVCL